MLLGPPNSFALVAPAVAAAKATAAEEQLDLRVDIREEVTTTPADTVVLGGELLNWKKLLPAGDRWGDVGGMGMGSK